ncbi:MAG: CHAP domain-containing protein [Ileibacterium sp.]|nr:CHAP domain-containing protein [Ileibacterium sp.]
MNCKNSAFAGVFCATMLTSTLTMVITAEPEAAAPGTADNSGSEDFVEFDPRTVSTEQAGTDIQPAAEPPADQGNPAAGDGQLPSVQEETADAPATNEQNVPEAGGSEQTAPENPGTTPENNEDVKPSEPGKNPEEGKDKDKDKDKEEDKDKEKDPEKDPEKSNAKKFVEEHQLLTHYLPQYLSSFGSLNTVVRNGNEYLILPTATQVMPKQAEETAAEPEKKEEAAASSETKAADEKTDPSAAKEEKKTEEASSEKKTVIEEITSIAKSADPLVVSADAFNAADYMSFFNTYSTFLQMPSEEQGEVNGLVMEALSQNSMAKLAKTAVAAVNSQPYTVRQQFEGILSSIRAMDSSLPMLLPPTEEEAGGKDKPVTPTEEEKKPAADNKQEENKKPQTEEKKEDPANAAAAAVAQEVLPVMERISYSNYGHGTNRRITINGLGSYMLLPDFTNSRAWKESVSAYNTPYLWGQCTWFAWGRFYEIYGFNPGFTGNGYECAGQLAKAHPDKFELSKTPVSGAIFSADAAHNHVGIVLEYDPKTDLMTIQEGNLDGVSNPDWNVAIEDYRTIEITPAQLRSMYGNVTYAVPKASAYKQLAMETLKSKSLRQRVLDRLRAAYMED